MSRRAGLWVAFAVVHLALIGLGLADSKSASWDVDQLYRFWAATVVGGGGIPGVTEDWVYPALALVPMLVAGLFGSFADYTVAWGVLLTAADALVFALLVGNGRSRGRTTAAWFWLAGALALGGVGMFRLDGVTVPLAIAGALWLVRRPWLGSALLAIATWIKVWPAAIIAAAVIAVRRRGAVLGAAAAVSAAIVLLLVALGGGGHVLSFVGEQTTRGLQVEAPISTPYLWLSISGAASARVYYNPDLIAFEVTGDHMDEVAAAMTPVMAAALSAILILGAFKAWRGASFVRLFPSLSLALVLSLVVFNKVGSPQYMIWLVPPLVIGLVLERRRWRIPAIAAVVILALTQVIFPWLYDALLVLQPGMVAVLTARNLLMVGLLVWAIARLARAPQRARHPALDRSTR